MDNDDLEVKQNVVQVISDWLINLIKLNIQVYLIKVTVTIALSENKNTQVNANTSIIAIRNTIESNRNKNVSTKTYPQLNHLFQECNKSTIMNIES